MVMASIGADHMNRTILAGDYSAELGALTPRTLPFSFNGLYGYLTGKVTPARVLTEAAAAFLMPSLSGDIIEIGALRNDFGKYADPSSRYVLSNISEVGDFFYLDAMNMHLADDSVDNFVCISVLEHIPDPFRAVGEMKRTLKKGGKLLLMVPFLYPFHADPSDFYRYTDKGLAVMLKGFRIDHAESLGNSFGAVALILQKPFRSTALDRLRRERRLLYLAKKLVAAPVTMLCRLLGTLFYLLSILARKPSDYACMYCVVAEKI